MGRWITALAAVAVASAVLAAVGSTTPSRTITLNPGEGFFVEDTELLCTYGGRAGTSGGLGCRFDSSSSRLVRSYLVSFGPEALSVSRIDAPGASTSVFERKQPFPRPVLLDQDYFRIQTVDTLTAGDAVRLSGTHVECFVKLKAVVTPDAVGVRCRLVRSKPVAGEYRASIDEHGVIVRQVVAKRVKVRKGRKTKTRTVFETKILFQRSHGQ